MNDLSAILAQSVERLFVDLAQCDPADAAAWEAIDSMGLTALFLPEKDGGMEGRWADAEPVFRACGYHALPFPVGETMIGNRLLCESGIDLPGKPIAFGVADGNIAQDNRFSGEVVANSPTSAGMLVLAELTGGVILLDTAEVDAREALTNTAGEGRDRVSFNDVPCQRVEGLGAETLFRLGAFLRTAQIGGALAACLELTSNYAQERSQFGRELRKFQAIQHQIALLAEECAAIFSASASAASALDTGDADFAIACAKLRANMASGQAALIAHQVHGAIGITEEYDLHRYTNRLWAWRSEFGNDRRWAQQLGQCILSSETETAWEVLTQRRTP